MTDKKSDQSKPVPTATPTTDARRRLLKRLATGGGVIAAGGMLPQKWTAPVVQSVMLPAHATATPTPTPTPSPTPTPTPPGAGDCEIDDVVVCSQTTGTGLECSAIFKTVSGPAPINLGCVSNTDDLIITMNGLPNPAYVSITGDGNCNINCDDGSLTTNIGPGTAAIAVQLTGSAGLKSFTVMVNGESCGTVSWDQCNSQDCCNGPS